MNKGTWYREMGRGGEPNHSSKKIRTLLVPHSKKNDRISACSPVFTVFGTFVAQKNTCHCRSQTSGRKRNANPFFWKKNEPAQPCTALHSKPKSDYLGEILNGFLIIIDRIAWVLKSTESRGFQISGKSESIRAKS